MKADWRRLFLYLAIAVMEGCWLYALLSMLNGQLAEGRLNVWLLLLLYPVAAGFYRLLLRFRWPVFACRLAGWVLWAAAVLLVIKFSLYGGLAWSDSGWLLAVPRALAVIFYSFEPEILLLLGSLLVWWLGWRLARLGTRFALLVGEFQFGLVILLAVFFGASQWEIATGDSLPVVLAFFIFALSGIPVAHSLEGDGWLSGLYKGHWMGLLLLGIGLIILVGLLISWVVSPDFLQVIVGGLKWLWAQVLKVIEFILSLLPQPEPGEISEVPVEGVGATSNETVSDYFALPDWLRNGLKTGWTLMLLGIIVLALWRVSSDVFGWMRRRLAGLAGAEYEAVPTTFRADLLNLLRRIWRGMLRALGRLRFRRKSVTMPPEVAPVRQLYRQLLRRAAKAGCGRGVAQTPYEYLQVLAERLPEACEDIDMMTRQYVAVRYGTLRPDEAEIGRLRQSWQRVKRYRIRKKDQKR